MSSSQCAGIVHREANGTIYFDDYPVRDASRLPRNPRLAGKIWYCTSSMNSKSWFSLMKPGDTAYGSPSTGITGVEFQCGNAGKMKVLSAEVWGVNTRDPNYCSDEIDDIRAMAIASDLPRRTTAAATAMALYTTRFDGLYPIPRMRQLEPRWRNLARNAMNVGPVSVLKASADYAVHLDVRRAYLAALMEPVPVLGFDLEGNKVGRYDTYTNPRWDRVRLFHGLIEATVFVRGSLGHSLPPLPIQREGSTCYPNGTIRGTWTIDHLREVEERGEVEVLKIHQMARSMVNEPIFAPLAEHIDTLPTKLGKLMYTRLYGKFSSEGFFTGQMSDQVLKGHHPGHGLYWKWGGIQYWSKARPTYRPDIAATIIAHNQRNVISACRQLAHDSVLATHVDAIWTSDVEGAARLVDQKQGVGSWSAKKSGPIRIYGIGMYAHADRLVCSGYDPAVKGPLTVEKLQRFANHEAEASRTSESRRRMNIIDRETNEASKHANIANFHTLLRTRDWSSDPTLDAAATSRPLELDMSGSVALDPITVYDKDWNSAGWHRRSDELDAAEQAKYLDLKVESDDVPDDVE